MDVIAGIQWKAQSATGRAVGTSVEISVGSGVRTGVETSVGEQLLLDRRKRGGKPKGPPVVFGGTGAGRCIGVQPHQQLRGRGGQLPHHAHQLLFDQPPRLCGQRSEDPAGTHRAMAPPDNCLDATGRAGRSADTSRDGSTSAAHAAAVQRRACPGCNWGCFAQVPRRSRAVPAMSAPRAPAARTRSSQECSHRSMSTRGFTAGSSPGVCETGTTAPRFGSVVCQAIIAIVAAVVIRFNRDLAIAIPASTSPVQLRLDAAMLACCECSCM